MDKFVDIKAIKGNNSSTTVYILMKLYKPHHTLDIYTQYKFHEIPSFAY